MCKPMDCAQSQITHMGNAHKHNGMYLSSFSFDVIASSVALITLNIKFL